MSRQIFVGMVTEGTTDRRFLESIIKKTLEGVAFECKGEIEIELNAIKIKKVRFADDVLMASKVGAEEYGIMMLCVHADADDDDEILAFRDRILPAIQLVEEYEEENICKTIIAVVPVRMTEAWMLADKDLLKREIGTSLSDIDLGIHRNPEAFANPKHTISQAIRTAREGFARRRRSDLTISDLYLPIGQKISLEKLAALPSYNKFKNEVRDAFRKLNYLH